MQVTEIITDDSMRELRLHGTDDFPFAYYIDDIHAYTKQYIEYHWHMEFEWCMVSSGTVECRIGSESIFLYEEDCIFINSKAIHSFESESGAIMPNILFSPTLIAPDVSAIYSEYVLPVLNTDSSYFVLRKADGKAGRIQQLLKEIFRLAEQETVSKIDIQIAVCTLWRDFVKSAAGCLDSGSNTQNMLLQSRIRKMLEFMRKNYTEKMTLTDIARAANISKSEALRCFHKATQTTPVQYLINYRLRQAKRLLLATNDTVTQIASKVGFDNISYFIRIFRKEFGLTPREFRLRKQNPKR